MDSRVIWDDLGTFLEDNDQVVTWWIFAQIEMCGLWGDLGTFQEDHDQVVTWWIFAQIEMCLMRRSVSEEGVRWEC